MQYDYILIGQGICGTFLSYYLRQSGKKILVIDEAKASTATKVASGVINPVTGRRVVATWMIDELLPFTWNAYTAIGSAIGEPVIEDKTTISFISSVQMKETYEKRITEAGTYIKPVTDNDYNTYFYYVFGCYCIEPTYLIYLHPLLQQWRNLLQQNYALFEEKFEPTDLIIQPNHVLYKNITAEKIIFCNGVQAFEMQWWKNLPYVFNKGQALVVDIPGLPQNNMYKYGALTLVPWYNNLWWAGSSYENDYETTEPTDAFRNATINSLKSVCKLPFTVIDHLAAIRPAALERRPFVGLHPHHPALGILNGMGTKGCSLAPYFAQQLCNYLVNDEVIDTLADVQRFKRILSDV